MSDTQCVFMTKDMLKMMTFNRLLVSRAELIKPHVYEAIPSFASAGKDALCKLVAEYADGPVEESPSPGI